MPHLDPAPLEKGQGRPGVGVPPPRPAGDLGHGEDEGEEVLSALLHLHLDAGPVEAHQLPEQEEWPVPELFGLLRNY